MKFHQPKTQQALQIFEVRVMNSSGTNVAAGTAAFQSSTYTSESGEHFPASNAIDGDVSTFSHTNDESPWLEIDLGESVPVTSVSILNRWCENPSDPLSCLCSLSGATLSLIDDLGEELVSNIIGDTCGQTNMEFVFESSSEFCEATVSYDAVCGICTMPSASTALIIISVLFFDLSQHRRLPQFLLQLSRNVVEYYERGRQSVRYGRA